MSKTALLVIDVQEGVGARASGARNNPDAESNIALLLSRWRERRHTVVHVQHCSEHPTSALRVGLPGNEFKAVARPQGGERVFNKSTNSAFVGTTLDAYLRSQGIASLVIVGLTTDHCVSASTRSASDLGFDATLVSDATAAFGTNGFDGVFYSGHDIHQINLVSLDGEFCKVLSTEAVLNTFE